ncbi:MAG: hypothetical protein BJ554DRAFT_380, partial [Olpidium bornovanus]
KRPISEAFFRDADQTSFCRLFLPPPPTTLPLKYSPGRSWLVCRCGQVMHDDCFDELRHHAYPGEPSCPLCHGVLDDNFLPVPELLVKALKLFEEKRWMPASTEEFAEPFDLPETFGKYMTDRMEAQVDFALLSMLEAAQLIHDYDPLPRELAGKLIAEATESLFPEVFHPEDSPADSSDGAAANWISPAAFLHTQFQKALRWPKLPGLVVGRPTEWYERLERLSMLVGEVRNILHNFAEKPQVERETTEQGPFSMYTAYKSHFEQLNKFFKNTQGINAIWSSLISSTNVYALRRWAGSSAVSVRKDVEKLRNIELHLPS